MLYCCGCENTFEYEDLSDIVEDYGEHTKVCPHCGDVPSEAVTCDVCDKVVADADSIDGMCRGCFEKKEYGDE